MQEERRIRRIHAAETLADALTHLRDHAPDVIVLDLNLPDVSGMDGLIRLAGASGTTPIVVVSSMTEPRVISAARLSTTRLQSNGWVQTGPNINIVESTRFEAESFAIQ